jgi:sugar phosphate isomerase/epimerase
MWPEVRDWMADQADYSEKADLILLQENDGRFFGAFPENMHRILSEFGSPSFRGLFDFANTVLIGYRPMRDWFPWLLPHLDTIHVKDAIESEGRVVPAGQGEGQVVETLRYLQESGWAGPLTLEPHLKEAGLRAGFSGEESFGQAVSALRSVLHLAGVTA